MARLICALVLSIAFGGCSRSGDVEAAPRPARTEIWAFIESRAAHYRLEPAFVYALVAAESNFDPRARNGEACGLLQIKPVAWREVSTAPFEPGVWDWRTNLEVGIDYLAFTRAYLHRKNVFSYPLLLAAFHYGIEQVENRGFDVRQVTIPKNEIYRQLWAGSLAPIPPPVSTESGNKKPAAEAAGR